MLRSVAVRPYWPLIWLGTAVACTAVIVTPMLVAAGIAAALVVAGFARWGVPAGIVILAVLALSAGGLLPRYVPQFAGLNQVAVLGLLAVGLCVRPKLPTGVTRAGLAFLGLATLYALIAAVRHPEYGFRAWVALVLPVVVVRAVVGVTRAGKMPGEVRLALVGAVALAVVVNSLVAIRQAFNGLDAAELAQVAASASTYSVGGNVRLMGTFATNQDFGAFLAVTVPAVLVVALRSSGAGRWWALGVYLLGLFAAFLSLTRTSLVSVAVVSIMALIVWSKGSKSTRVFRAVAVFAAGGWALTLILSAVEAERVRDAVERASTIFNLAADKSYNERASETLPQSFGAFFSHPVGAGAGSAGPVSQQFADIAPLGEFTSDNGYLMVGIQLGWVGLGVFVWMLGAAVQALWVRMEWAATASVLSLLVAMLTAQYWSLLAPLAVCAVIVGLGFKPEGATDAVHVGIPPSDTSHL